MASDELTREAAPAVRLHPGFRPTAVLLRTDKSTLVTGRCHGAPVVAKILTSTQLPWRNRFAHEVETYRALTRTPPPVHTPRLVAADGSALITEHVPGRHPVPDRERYSRHQVAAADLETLIEVLARIGSWSTPAPACPQVFDHREQIRREHGRGLLTTRHVHALTELSEQVTAPRAFAHGDPVLTNFLIGDHGRPTLIDWEHSGHYLPGYDLAVLWTVVAHTPHARARIEDHIAARPPSTRAAFTVNRILVLARELRIHREVPPAPWRDARIAALTRDWNALDRTLPG